MFSEGGLEKLVPRDNPVPVRRLMHFSDVERRCWKRRRWLNTISGNNARTTEHLTAVKR